MSTLLQVLGVLGGTLVGLSVLLVYMLSLRVPGQAPPAPSEPQERLRRALIMMLCGLVIILGLGISGAGTQTIWRGYASKSWPHAHGRITRSVLKTEQRPRGSNSWPDIGYRYVVDDHALTGDCISFGNGGGPSGRAAALRCLQRYPVDRAVTIAYQPDHPTLSVLEPGLTRRTFMGLAAGLFVITVGLYGWWVYQHRLQLFVPRVQPWWMLPPMVGYGVFLFFMIWAQTG